MKRKADTTTPTALFTASSEFSPVLNEPKVAKPCRGENDCSLPEKFPKRDVPDSQQSPEVVKKVQLSEQLKHCNEILKEMFLKKHAAYAWPFYKSADIAALGLDIIKCPMDLGIIKVSGFRLEYISGFLVP